MQAKQGITAVAALAMLALAGCSSGEPQLMNLRATGNGPDEFAILPPKPLEMPEDLTALPEPDLGGANRTDPTPEADAIVALGGRPGTATGVPAGDSALVNHASRNGRTAGVREDLAVADLEFRRDNNGRLLERLFNVTSYFRVYRPDSLDQQAELKRWRKVGARTVSAPPPERGE